jgi:uncharacterized membrane protein
VIAYIFSFIGALIVLAMEKQNSLVRFHAMQAFIFGLVNLVVRIVLAILTGIFLFTNGIWWIFNTLGWILWLAYLGVTIWMIVEGINGRRTKIPVVGDYAEKYAPTFMR